MNDRIGKKAIIVDEPHAGEIVIIKDVGDMIIVELKYTEGFTFAQAELNAENLRLIPDDISESMAQNLMRVLPKITS